MPSTRHSEAPTATLKSPGVEAGFAATTPEDLERLVHDQLEELVENLRLVSGMGPWVQFTGSEKRGRDRIIVWVRARAGLHEGAIAEVLDAAERLRPSAPPAVLPVRRLGCTFDLIWLTAKEYAGSSLTEWYGGGQVPSVAGAQTFLGLVLGPLQAMHESGIVHGALSVASFHRDTEGVIRVLRPGVDVPILRADLATGATSAAAANAAPEVRAGGPPVAASDQYALAAMLVALLTGRPPGVDGHHASDDVPKAWRPILRRALAAVPAQRFPDLAAFGQALKSAPLAPSAPSRVDTRVAERTPANGKYVPSAFGPRAGARLRAPAPGAGEQVLFPDEAWEAPRDFGAQVSRTGTPAGRAFSTLLLLLSLGALALLYERFAAGRSESAPVAMELPPAPPDRLAEEVTPPTPVATPTASTPTRAEAEPPTDPTDPPPSRPRPEPQPTPTAAPAEPRVTAPAAEPTPRPTPTLVPPPTPTATPTPTTQPPAPPGSLSMQTYPWGSVYIDGRYVGTTPLIELSVPAGPHQIRVEREGLPTYIRDVIVPPGQALRLTGIVLGEPSR